MSDLANCPFCDTALDDRAFRPFLMPDGEPRCQIWCEYCGATGGHADSDARAAELWNRRATLQTISRISSELASVTGLMQLHRARVDSLEVAIRAELEHLSDAIGTHWEGCEWSHRKCAAIMRLKQALATQTPGKGQ